MYKLYKHLHGFWRELHTVLERVNPWCKRCVGSQLQRPWILQIWRWSVLRKYLSEAAEDGSTLNWSSSWCFNCFDRFDGIKQFKSCRHWLINHEFVPWRSATATLLGDEQVTDHGALANRKRRHPSKRSNFLFRTSEPCNIFISKTGKTNRKRFTSYKERAWAIELKLCATRLHFQLLHLKR